MKHTTIQPEVYLTAMGCKSIMSLLSLDDDVIQDFLWNDCCAKLLDKVIKF